MPGILALGRLKSEGLWQGSGQTGLPREIVSENENKLGCGATHLGDSRTASYTQYFLGTCLSASLPGPAQDSAHTSLGLAQAVSINRLLVSHTPFLSSFPKLKA